MRAVMFKLLHPPYMLLLAACADTELTQPRRLMQRMCSVSCCWQAASYDAGLVAGGGSEGRDR